MNDANVILNLFPRYIVMLERKKLVNYLNKDLSETGINSRISLMIDSKPISDDMKKRLYQACIEVAAQIISKKIPPYLLESNLDSCKIGNYIITDKDFELMKKGLKVFTGATYNSIHNELLLVEDNERNNQHVNEINPKVFLSDLIPLIYKHETEHMSSHSRLESLPMAWYYMCDTIQFIMEAMTEKLTNEDSGIINIYRIPLFILELIETITNHDFTIEYYTANYKKILNILKINHCMDNLKAFDTVMMEMQWMIPSTDEYYSKLLNIYFTTLKKDYQYEANKQKCILYAEQNIPRFLK